MLVGQCVYIRGNHKGEIKEKKVSKVGRKYFYLENEHYANRYFLDSMKSDCKIGYPTKIYLSEQQILDENEFIELEKEVKGYFGWGGNKKYNLEKLRRVKKIMEEE